MPPSDLALVYQLRLRLDRISPLIWRRLLVRNTTSLAELHAIIQLAFGWSDNHRYQFHIHGKTYGLAYLGGPSFADAPDTVRLADFGFRPGERFFYEYNFYAPWYHELRLEQILPAAPGRRYPVCIGDARAIPLRSVLVPQHFSPAPGWLALTTRGL